MVPTPARRERDSAYRLGAFVLLLAIIGISTALAFEYFGGYAPCPLCLMQRWAYYAAIPVLFIALVLVTAEHPRWAAALFSAVFLAFLANAGLGAYHAGAEWQFWPGPDTCASTTLPLRASAGTLLEQLAQPAPVVRCDRAAWRLFGLSFAGWNVLLSLAASAASLQAALTASPR